MCQWHTDGCCRPKQVFRASGNKITIGTGMVRVLLMLLIRDRGGEQWKLIPIVLWKMNVSIGLARWVQFRGWGVRNFILIVLT